MFMWFDSMFVMFSKGQSKVLSVFPALTNWQILFFPPIFFTIWFILLSISLFVAPVLLALDFTVDYSQTFFMILLILPVLFIVYLTFMQYRYYQPTKNSLVQNNQQYLAFFKQNLKIFMVIYAIFYTLLTFQLFNSQALVLEMGSGLLVNETQNNYLMLGGFFDFLSTYFQAPLAFVFYIDILGVLFMGLSMILVFLCILFLWPTFELEKNLVLYVSQLLILLAQLQMTFAAANLLTFFLAFESLLIPMIIMISIWGSPNRRQANNYLVFYTMVSAIPMLLAIIYIHQKYGNLNINYLMSVLSWTWTEQFWLWCAFFFAFAVKTPMVPVHIWLPKAHVDAPTVGSVILAGLLLKVGLIGFIRILLPLFPEATHFFAPYVSALATVGVLYSSLITLRQIDMKRIIAYSSVAHMNMAVVSLCSLNPIGLYSTIYLMLSHGLIASGLFFLVGFLYNRFHVRTVAYFGGLATIMPVMTVVFFIFSLANMAFPFTSGFIGEFLLLLGITSTNFFLGFCNATSMLITTVYTMLLFGRVFLGELKPQFQQLVQQVVDVSTDNKLTGMPFLSRKFSIYDLYYYEFIIVGILMIGIFWWGCYPQILLNSLLASPTLVIVCNSF